MPTPPDPELYERYRRAMGDRPLPAALVDLDALDRNIDALVAPLRAHGKRLRVASKSVRCVAVLQHIIARAGDIVAGAMAFTAYEAAVLADHGFDDVLLAYPTARAADAAVLAAANARGATVSVVVDDLEPLDVLSDAGVRAGVRVPVVVEVDLAYHPAGTAVHLGVRRSPLRTAADVVAVARAVRDRPGLAFHGVMGYEAQIAGLTDASPFARWMNAPKRWMKHRARPSVEATRRDVLAALQGAGLAPAVFNAGGTGSVAWCSAEPGVTEVTVGSGFLAGHLFDYYRDLSLQPALAFALQAARRPAPGMVTCHGGGYVASGEPGADRLPLPYLPRGMELLAWEGAGEVQTPVRLPPGVHIPLGEPVFFRPAKSGELAERFDRYALVRGAQIVADAPTYRGAGWCFL